MPPNNCHGHIIANHQSFWAPSGETGSVIIDLFAKFLPGCCWLELFGNHQELQLGVEPLFNKVEMSFRGSFFWIYDDILTLDQSAEFLLAKSNVPGDFHPKAIHSLKNACSSPPFLCSRTIRTLYIFHFCKKINLFRLHQTVSLNS